MKPSIQKILIGVIIVIVLAFIIMRGDQLVELVETMSRGAIIPLVLAIVTQLCKYFAQSWAYHFSFAAVRVRHLLQEHHRAVAEHGRCHLGGR